jgi:hypothetical protein
VGDHVAGNLRNMFRDIVAVGSDVDQRVAAHGFDLVDRMTVVGR